VPFSGGLAVNKNVNNKRAYRSEKNSLHTQATASQRTAARQTGKHNNGASYQHDARNALSLLRRRRHCRRPLAEAHPDDRRH
jgi:hypothetical protein